MPPQVPVVQASRQVALSRETLWVVVLDAYLAAAVDSEHTRRAYRRHLAQAFTMLDVTTLGELTGADLARYRAALTVTELSPASHAQALAALRSFLTWGRALGAHHLSSDVVRTALKTPSATVGSTV